MQWKKNSETPMDKGQKPNETQESRVEEKRNITTVVNNSSNIGEERKTAAVVVRTSDSVNLLRRRGREESYEAWMETSGRDGAAAPEGDVGRVVAALQQLPKTYGAVLELVCTGWSTAEIAEHLGLSPRTVQRRLERAREMIREELSENDAADPGRGL